MATKQFHVGDLLSVTTGRIVARRHVDALYDLLGHMTGDSPFTHQLPRFGDECKPWLYRWFPELESVDDGILGDMIDIHGPEKGCETWVDAMVSSRGIREWYDVPQIPKDDHSRRCPIEELRQMAPDAQIIVMKD